MTLGEATVVGRERGHVVGRGVDPQMDEGVIQLVTKLNVTWLTGKFPSHRYGG
jgi:hypothetical protein